MMTKLTLTIDREVINAAKSYARKMGVSLSCLVGNYLKTLVENESVTENFSPRIKRLFGAIKLTYDVDYKETLSKEIAKKHEKPV